MAEAAQRDKLNVFISYSRDDLAFADQLDAALGLAGFSTSIDRQAISGGEEWEKRLGALIRAADTVVFVLSPSSARSKTCAWEVDEAVRLGKRILPVLCCPLEGASPPPQLAALNYIFFYAEPRSPGSGFGAGLVQLASALNTDLDWLREHTRYLQRATEWDAGGRPANRLLSGPDIESAKTWAAGRPKNTPEPTALHLDFIKASEAEDIRQQSVEAQRLRQLEEALVEREKALEREAEQARLVVQQRDRALLQESRALAIFAQIASKAGNQPTAMLLALEALPDPGFGGARPWSSHAAAALHQAWLRNRERALAGHRGAITCASFSADGTYVVTASWDKTARVWDLRGERPSYVALEGHQRGVVSASFSADGTHVVTGGFDGTARVWDLRGERPTFVTLEHINVGSIAVSIAVDSASFSADGTHVVTASWKGTHLAWVWDLRVNPPSFVTLEGIRVRSAPRRSAPTGRMWSRPPMTARRGCGTYAAIGRASSPSRGIRVQSAPRRSAPTGRMWSRPPMTARHGCGT
jgi:TIR domain/WD domain, G-beta repeat